MENEQATVVTTSNEPQKKVTQRKFKPLSFFAGLLHVIVAIALIILAGSMVVGALDTTSDPQWVILMTVFGGLIVVIALAAILALAALFMLILGILQMVFAGGSNAKYHSRRPFFVAIIVIDFILLGIFGIAALIANGSSDIDPTVVTICYCFVGALLASIIFNIVDLIIFNNRVKKGIIEITKPTPMLVTPVASLATAPVVNPAEQTAKLDELYNSGSITREEYDKLKADAEAK